MAGYQSQSNAYVAYKVQTDLGAQASGSGGNVLLISGGPGGKMTKAATESNAVRRDGMRTRGRHGTQKASGSYTIELGMGQADEIFEALWRGTYETALTITEATAGLTSITTTTGTIVASAGSWITAGLRVGDVIRLTGHATAGNNGRNLRITGLTASTITVGELLTLNATPDTAFTIVRPGRKLINPPPGSLIERYFTIEEPELDIDASEVFTDAKFGSGKWTMQPNGIVTHDTGWTGTGQFEILTGGASPLLTSPTEPTGSGLAVVDATIRIGGDFVDLTSFDVTIDLQPNAPDVFGSGNIKYSPDVFLGQMGVAINFSCLRKDLARVQDFNEETQCDMHILMAANASEPKDFHSMYIGNFTLGGVDKSALNKAGGPRTQSIQVPMALVGIDERGGAYDTCMVKYQISNAA